MPVEQAVAAVEECGAPMVSIAGGEPLMHPQIHVITEELLKRKKFVVLCTNAVLLPKHIDKFKPNKNFAWMVHLDGIGERHDEAVAKEGVFDQAVEAIKLAKSKGFAVYTNTTVFNTDTPQDLIDTLDYINNELGVDRLEIAPGYAYAKAPDQDRFLGVRRPASCSARRSPTAAARSGASTTRRSTWTSSRARPTSSAPRGACRCTRCRAGSGPAT